MSMPQSLWGSLRRGTVLLPAIFFASLGKLNIWYVLAVAIAATVISDVGWYFVGKYFHKEKLLSLSMLAKRRHAFDRLSAVFEKHDIKIIIFAKYIYGFRIVVQIISGMHHMPFRRYLAANAAAIVIFLGSLVGLSYTIAKSVAGLEDLTYTISIGLTAFILLAVLLHFIVKKVLVKQARWFKLDK